jgi:hypothetical protein
LVGANSFTQIIYEPYTNEGIAIRHIGKNQIREMRRVQAEGDQSFVFE